MVLEKPAKAKEVLLTALVANKAGELVKGKQATELADDAFVEQVGRAVSEEAEPIDDIRGSAGFRREITATLAQRALITALGRAAGKTGPR